MSVHFVIGPFDPQLWLSEEAPVKPESSLRIDADTYREALLKRWPTARELQSEYFAGGVWWNLDEYNVLGIEVHLHKDLQTVTMSPYGVNLIEFILWHRAFVPAEYALFFHRSMHADRLVLTPATTKEDIYEFTGYRDDGLRKESLLNGTWDGFVIASDADDKTNYQCTLRLFDHGSELKVDLLLGKRSPKIGATYTELRGTGTDDLHRIALSRTRTINVIGGGLESGLEAYQVLDLRVEDGDPPSMHGICATVDQNVTVKLGDVQLTRRRLYDSPPSM